MAGQTYGYIRVSSKDQNEDRQRVALAEKEIPPKNLYVDKQSGKDFQRPQYQKLLRRLRAGEDHARAHGQAYGPGIQMPGPYVILPDPTVPGASVTRQSRGIGRSRSRRGCRCVPG